MFTLCPLFVTLSFYTYQNLHCLFVNLKEGCKKSNLRPERPKKYCVTALGKEKLTEHIKYMYSEDLSYSQNKKASITTQNCDYLITGN